MIDTDVQHRQVLQKIADRTLSEAGLLSRFSREALLEVSRLNGAASPEDPAIRDLVEPLWCSTDNDDSMDLDQLTVAQQLDGDRVRVMVAVADVDALVKEGSAINDHALHNTTSIYTAARIYPMLPDRLSTDLTSLAQGDERLTMVVDMVIDAEGAVAESAVYRALVVNRAKLAYNAVSAWLLGQGPEPRAITAVPGLAENLRLQDTVAQRMKTLRHKHGALSLETIEAKAVFDGEQLTAFESYAKNRAQDIIENFMVAANGVTARYLSDNGFPSLRRVVRVPKRWDRIVELASQQGYSLPPTPDSRALDLFLVHERDTDPVHFPDLSLSVIKLLGSGEYIADMPGEKTPGHFGLAVKDYSHSTAPNRRYPDLITQRLLKAALASERPPYEEDLLKKLAEHCTVAEDVVQKVERRVEKSAAAIWMAPRVGQQFDAVVTGAADKGTWVRLLSMPVEGKLVRGFDGVDVGDRVRVQLTETNIEAGFIDFALVKRA